MGDWWKKLVTSYTGIFLICFIQVNLVTINMYQVANHKFYGMAVFGFLISFIWTFNVSSIVFGTIKQRIVYGLGGMCGCIVGGIITHYIY